LTYPPELAVKETTDTASSASSLEEYLELDESVQLSTTIYDKRDDFNFKIGCICIRFNFFSWYLQNRICCFYPSLRRL
jgi:hypothetical protein